MKIHHAGYLTRNIAVAQKEFRKLGYVTERDVAFDTYRKISIAFMVNGSYRVELIEPRGEESPLYPLLKKYKNTPYHFCYITENLENKLSELEKDGYRIIQAPLPAPCIGGAPVAFLMNPDMGIIELVELKEEEAAWA